MFFEKAPRTGALSRVGFAPLRNTCDYLCASVHVYELEAVLP